MQRSGIRGGNPPDSGLGLHPVYALIEELRAGLKGG